MDWNEQYGHKKKIYSHGSAFKATNMLLFLQFMFISCSIGQSSSEMKNREYGAVSKIVKICSPADVRICLNLSNNNEEILSVSKIDGNVIELTFSNSFPAAVAPFRTHVRLIYSPKLTVPDFINKVLNDEAATIIIDQSTQLSLEGIIQSNRARSGRAVIVDNKRLLKITSCFYSDTPILDRCEITWRHGSLGLLSASVMTKELDQFVIAIPTINQQLASYASPSLRVS
jgi:hypothetical protein